MRLPIWQVFRLYGYDRLGERSKKVCQRWDYQKIRLLLVAGLFNTGCRIVTSIGCIA